MKTKSTHLITILELLLEGKKLSSNDLFISNSNQYFVFLKKQGIALEEVWKPNVKNKGKHKERSLLKTENNLAKARSYLKYLKGIKSNESKES